MHPTTIRDLLLKIRRIDLLIMPLIASDFSGIAWVLLAIFLGIVVAGLVAGVITARLIVGFTKKRWVWWLVPVFAAGWFGIGWIVLSL